MMTFRVGRRGGLPKSRSFIQFMVVLAVYVVLSHLLSSEVYNAVIVILSPFVGLFYVIPKNFKEKISNEKLKGFISSVETILLYVGMFLTLHLLSQANKCKFESGNPIPFWDWSLVTALLMTLIAFVLRLYVKVPVKQFVAAVTVTAIVTFFISNFWFVNVNRIADTGEPEEYSAVVVDKDIVHGGRRRSTKHYLYLEMGDMEFKYDVSTKSFNNIEIGENVAIFYFEGALGKPFYSLWTN